eukprot:9672115-Ditylum_brightwellii.AAC.1
MLAVSRKTNAMSLAAFEVKKDIFRGIDIFEYGKVDVLSKDVGDSSNIKVCGTISQLREPTSERRRFWAWASFSDGRMSGGMELTGYPLQ